jgi:hypothetical protein
VPDQCHPLTAQTVLTHRRVLFQACVKQAHG